MDSQGKRTVIAIAACFAVLFGWMKLQEIWYPPVEQVATSGPETSSESQPSDAATTAISPSTAPASMSAGVFNVINADGAKSVVLGDDRQNDKRISFTNPYDFSVTVSPRGGAIERVRLSRYRNHVPKDKKNPDPDPYDLVLPVTGLEGVDPFLSFATLKIFLVDENQSVDLARAEWSVEKQSDDKGETASLRTTITKEGKPILALRKSFRVDKGSHHVASALVVENSSPQPRRVVVHERGPIGFQNEDPQRDSRRVSAAMVSYDKDEKGVPKLDPKGQVSLTFADASPHMRSDVEKAGAEGVEIKPIESQRILWSAIGNKYFGCIVTWLPTVGSKSPAADYLAKVTARFCVDDPTLSSDVNRINDLTFEQSLSPGAPIQPGASVEMRREIYCGPKSDSVFASMSPELQRRQYQRVSNADRAGCTFQVITSMMLWLLTNLQRLVHNYGIAIIIMVFIVRLILHPVTKSGQISMMKMQKGMASLKPKLDAIQEQYKNDKQKLNEETMKLYRVEGINPASSMFGCLPMFLQMPIWVALWTSLNTNVDLRHQPFFLWIHDLSIPDGIYTPAQPWNLHIPIISSLAGTINGFNLLPFIMTFTMYAQQKFMQKLTKPAVPPPVKLDADGQPVPDPMAQQQKMMSFMMLFFGLMFYNMPAGLNIYILCSNLMGMAEQYRIKTHLKVREARGDFDPTKRAATSGPRRLSWIERLQKRVEELRQAPHASDISRVGKSKKFRS
ncbi:MAG: membrane protein insertase YidC [Planctomycetota bacterium]